MTVEKLWALRQQIVLNSLYYSDYENAFGIDRHVVGDFFDGYLSFLTEIMKEEIPDYDDAHFFDYLREYDNADNLWDWYGCFEDNPLPMRTNEDAA